MKIIPIFTGRLYAFQYEELDEVTRLFQIWNDPEFLEEFFTNNYEDLQSGFFGKISKEDAIIQTRNEVKSLEKALTQLAKSDSLDDIFIPIDNSGLRQFEFLRVKGKGDRHKSWLRIYALKIDNNVYVITGGAIKLTKTMLERDHTSQELMKLERCKDYLKEEKITDLEGFKEISM